MKNSKIITIGPHVGRVVGKFILWLCSTERVDKKSLVLPLLEAEEEIKDLKEELHKRDMGYFVLRISSGLHSEEISFSGPTFARIVEVDGKRLHFALFQASSS